MTETPTAHSVQVLRGYVYQHLKSRASCTCGWAGAAYLDIANAYRDAFDHLDRARHPSSR